MAFDTKAAKVALFVEELQNDFIHPKGKMATKDHRHVIEHMKSLVHAPGFAFRVLIESLVAEDSICLAQNHSDKEPGDLAHIPNAFNPDHTYQMPLFPHITVPGSWGAEAVEGIEKAHYDIVLKKVQSEKHILISCISDVHGNSHADMPDGALSHDIKAELKKRGINIVVIIGAHGEFCVSHTATDLKKLGYQVIVVKDAVVFGEESAELKERVWKDLESKGVRLLNSDDPIMDGIKKGSGASLPAKGVHTI